MSSFVYEASLHWAAVALYIAGTALLAWSLIFDHPQRVRWALWAAAAGLIPHSIALGIRWVTVGHGPYLLKYEVLSSDAWIAVAMLLILVAFRRNLAPLALVGLPAAILTMGVGLFASPEASNLPPTLRSMWLVYHLFFAKIAAASFLLSAASATMLLLRLNGSSIRILDRLPGTAAIEAYTIRFMGFGFVFWTTTIGAGAIWANQSWGRYWGWDPIETWSLVTWLCYGTLIHARLFFKLNPRATAWGTLACFVVSVLTILIFPFVFPSLHSAYFQ